MPLRRILLFAALAASLVVLVLAGTVFGDQEHPKLGGGQVCTNEHIAGTNTPC